MSVATNLPRISQSHPSFTKKMIEATFLYKNYPNMPIKEIAEKIGIHFRSVNVMIYDHYFKQPNHFRRDRDLKK